MPVIGRISVGDGATFTPAIDSDGVLSFTNNKNLPNPEPFDIPGAVVNSGAMAPGSENGTIAFGGNDVAVTGWDTKANVASPAFTGTPTAPTPTSTDDSTKLATTSFVQSAKTSAVTSANNYTDEQIRQHGNLPVGHEYFSMNPNIPQGSLPLIGGVYSRETYADLWAWVQTQSGYLKTEAEWQTLSTANNGNVPFYSSGDGSTTFRVPSLHCWIKGSDGSAQLVGSYLQAGLPNVTGSFGGSDFIYPPTGSLSVASTGNAGGVNPAQANSFVGLNLDASLSNPIYGNANTVQPESIVGMWLVKCYGTVADTGTIDEQAYIDDRYNAMKTYVDNKFVPLDYQETATLLVQTSAQNGAVQFDLTTPYKRYAFVVEVTLSGENWIRGGVYEISRVMLLYKPSHSFNFGSSLENHVSGYFIFTQSSGGLSYAVYGIATPTGTIESNTLKIYGIK